MVQSDRPKHPMPGQSRRNQKKRTENPIITVLPQTCCWHGSVDSALLPRVIAGWTHHHHVV